MKSVSAALLSLINSGSFVDFTLYKFKLFNSETLLLTDADFPIVLRGGDFSPDFSPDFANYQSSAPADFSSDFSSDFTSYPVYIPGVIDPDGHQSHAHWKVGLDPDTWQVALAPRAYNDFTGELFPDKIGSVPLLEAIALGYFDNADVEISRAYFAQLPTHPIPFGGLAPVGTLLIFKGYCANTELTTSTANLTLTDYKGLLTIQLPRNLYGSGCRHTLFGAGCTLSASAYRATGTVGSGSSRGTIVTPVSLTAPAGSGTYTLGRIVMTSGLNLGFSRTISHWDNAKNLTLYSPFPYTPQVGDTFDIYPGCDKQLSTCKNFGNSVNFGGEPFIPAPEVTLGF